MCAVPATPVPPEWKEPAYKDVVRDVYQFQESLPLPFVTYPGVYGTWISFQEAADGQPYLCACSRSACVGFLRFNEQYRVHRLGPSQTLTDFFFRGGAAAANGFCVTSVSDFASSAVFRVGLCHLCNQRVPPVRWSNLGEHSVFLQHFGWYASMAMYAAGLDPIGDFIPSTLDAELQAFVEVDPVSTRRQLNEFLTRHRLWSGVLDRPASPSDDRRPGMAEIRRLRHALNRQTKAMKRCVEARLRTSLGFPSHGRTGSSEAILFWIVQALFEPAEVLRRVRLPFLGKLEVDLYVPASRLAIEYQGEQHYEALEHLGGLRSLRQVRKRDARKSALCKQNDVHLEYFTVADKLTEGFVAQRLFRYLS